MPKNHQKWRFLGFLTKNSRLTHYKLVLLYKSHATFVKNNMDFFGNLVINALCATILIVIFFANMRSCKGGAIGCHIFRLIIFSGIMMFIIDTIGRLDGASNISVPVANQIGNFLLFAFNPMVPILWLAYVVYQVYGKVKYLKKIALYGAIYMFVHIVIVVINLFFGYYYTIDVNNVYTRGAYYAVSVLFSLAPLFVAFTLTITNRNQIDYRKYNAFVFFPLSPVIGTILSFFTYGYSIVLPSMMIAYVLVFNNIQNDSMRVDYLTGVFNRRHLEDYLRRKISENNPWLAGIMLDIDNYKAINDVHGHLVGDRALIDFAHILQKSIRNNDIVARYGGDEFVIILEAKNEKILKDVYENIIANIIEFNQREIYPFKMTASMGKAIYVPEEKKTMEQFINQLDNLMYEDKKKNRSQID